jgi:hypothetical protein
MNVMFPGQWRAVIAVLSALACTLDSPGSRLPVRSVSIMPAQTSGVVGDLATFGVVLRDDGGNFVKNKSVQWSTSNEAVARVSPSGLVEAVGPGNVVITATVDGVVGTSTVNVIDSAVVIQPPPPPLPPDTNAPPPTGPPPDASPSPTPTGPVASVTLVPEFMSVGPLATSQFAAVTRDNQNRVLGDRAVTWSVVNGLIASVTGSGLVSGILAGNTSVRAVSEGVSATAPVSVVLGAQSARIWPNLPAGFAPLTDEAFTDASLARFWSLIWNHNNNGSMVTDNESPFSPGGVFQVRYPAGFVAGEAPATLYYDLGRIRNVYVGLWWKANSNWQGHESNVNKIQFLFPAEGNGDLVMVAYGSPGGPYELRCNLQLVSGETRSWLRPNVDPGRVTMGDWHRIEWLVQYNTAGQRDGVMRWWLDGKLVGDYRDILFPVALLDNYKVSPTYGGVGGAKTQTDYYWYDHVFIAWK